MIPTNETNPILAHLRKCAEAGHIPTVNEVHALAQFRQAGGLERLCTALRQVAVNHRAAIKNGEVR